MSKYKKIDLDNLNFDELKPDKLHEEYRHYTNECILSLIIAIFLFVGWILTVILLHSHSLSFSFKDNIEFLILMTILLCVNIRALKRYKRLELIFDKARRTSIIFWLKEDKCEYKSYPRKLSDLPPDERN